MTDASLPMLSSSLDFREEHAAPFLSPTHAAPLPNTTNNPAPQSFWAEFLQTKGPPQIVVLVVLLVVGVFSTVGVVPAVMTDRYARLDHGYTDHRPCHDFATAEKPDACRLGSATAQTSAALATMVSNGLTFLASSWMGSLSDEYGRRVVLMASVTLWALPQVALLILLWLPHLSPVWYYGGVSVSGIVSWIAIGTSSMADVVAPESRAAAFGLAMAGYALGVSLAPLLAAVWGHIPVALVSVVSVGTALAVVCLWLPETLPPERALQARTMRMQQWQSLEGPTQKVLWLMYRPVWELSILNRSNLFRILAIVAFCSDACTGGLQTLLVYYVEERLSFTDANIAAMYLLTGCLGVVVQSVVVKMVNDAWGAPRVVMSAYALGAVINLLYALVPRRFMIFTGVALSALVDMAVPTISAIKSNHADPSEQGRIQGAFYSVTALAYAFGPAAMGLVSSYTKDGAFLGPGSMFLVLSGLYIVAVVGSYALPFKTDSRHATAQQATDDRECTAETPLRSPA